MKLLSVAMISEELAEELGVDFKDKNGEYVVSLALAQHLEPWEFSVTNAEIDEMEGTLPVDPTKPILRPKKK